MKGAVRSVTVSLETELSFGKQWSMKLHSVTAGPAGRHWFVT